MMTCEVTGSRQNHRNGFPISVKVILPEFEKTSTVAQNRSKGDLFYIKKIGATLWKLFVMTQRRRQWVS